MSKANNKSQAAKSSKDFARSDIAESELMTILDHQMQQCSLAASLVEAAQVRMKEELEILGSIKNALLIKKKNKNQGKTTCDACLKRAEEEREKEIMETKNTNKEPGQVSVCDETNALILLVDRCADLDSQSSMQIKFGKLKNILHKWFEEREFLDIEQFNDRRRFDLPFTTVYYSLLIRWKKDDDTQWTVCMPCCGTCANFKKSTYIRQIGHVSSCPLSMERVLDDIIVNDLSPEEGISRAYNLIRGDNKPCHKYLEKVAEDNPDFILAKWSCCGATFLYINQWGEVAVNPEPKSGCICGKSSDSHNWLAEIRGVEQRIKDAKLHEEKKKFLLSNSKRV